MSEERIEQPQGPINPDDVRTPGPGGGEQPATMLDTGRPVMEFSGVPTGRDNRFDDPPVRTDAPNLGRAEEGDSDFESKSIADKLAYARERLGDDVYVLDAGSEVFNQSGARVSLRTPAAIQLSNGGGDPRANDTKFAGFLHDSDRNWGLNIGQMERPFNRATATPIVLTCVEHGEDLEYAPYGAPRQCPKCAADALAAAAVVQLEAATTEITREEEELRRRSVRPVEPIKVGDVVISPVELDDANGGIGRGQEMTVISIEFGTALCQWFDHDQLQERTYDVSVLRKVR